MVATGPKRPKYHKVPRLDDRIPEDCELLEYRPRGAAADLWRLQVPEILMDGPAGTGKTRALAQRTLHDMEAYPGCRIAWLRYTRASLSETVLATWENKVLSPVNHPMLRGPQRSHRPSYVHPNGSELILGGFDRVSKLFSMELDAAYVFEAIETTETQVTSLKRALRNGVMPWHPLYMDTNPGPWHHWLNQRCSDINPKGRLKRLRSSFNDNPTVTLGYLEELDKGMSGHMRDRMFLGLWVGSQGLVLRDFGQHNILKMGPEDIPTDGTEPSALSVRIHGTRQYLILPKRSPVGDPVDIDGDFYDKAVAVEYWCAGIDWGAKAPASLQLWAVAKVRGAFRAFLVEQYYRPMRIQDYGAVTAKWHRRHGLHRVICDGAEKAQIDYLNDNVFRHDGAALAVRANKAWHVGIDNMNYCFREDAKGLPRVFVFDNSLQHPPMAELVNEKRPFDFVTEAHSLQWAEQLEGKRDHEKTDGAPDHAIDAGRYVLIDLFGRESPLEEPGAVRTYRPGSMGEMMKHSERGIAMAPEPDWNLFDDDWVTA